MLGKIFYVQHYRQVSQNAFPGGLGIPWRAGHNRKLSGHHHCSLWLQAGAAGPRLDSGFLKSGGFLRQHLTEDVLSVLKEHLWLGFIASGPNHFCHEFWDLSSGWVCLSETDGCSNRIRSCITWVFIYDVFSFIYICFHCFWCCASTLSLPWLHTCSRKL